MDYRKLLEQEDLVKKEVEKVKDFIEEVAPEVTDLLTILGVMVVEVQARMMGHLMEKYQMTQDDAREVVMNSVNPMSQRIINK